MKNINTFLLLTIMCLAGSLISGCGGAANTANTAVNTNTAASKKEATLKPDDVTPDKAVKVDELVDAAVADKTPWIGKEVTVSAYVSGTSGSDGFIMTLTNGQDSKSGKTVSCKVLKGSSDGLLTKTVEVKGTIARAEKRDANYSNVALDPCELKK